MVEEYHPKNNEEKRNAVKEVLQEIVLYGLSKAGFFHKAAFYGGTALRIFYGLDRFSEALDFSLLVKDEDFDLSAYFPVLKTVVNSFGLKVDVEMKNKAKESWIQSAFLKGDTIEQFLLFYPNDEIYSINKNEKVKVKFEIDTCPADFAAYETKFQLMPFPHAVKVFDEASLFSGKIHAVICRSWKTRVKGRDLYDYVFYLSRNAKFNITYLREKLINSGFVGKNDRVELADVKKMLINRFDEIDYEAAKDDIIPFIKDKSLLDVWSKEFFIQITSELKERES